MTGDGAGSAGTATVRLRPLSHLGLWQQRFAALAAGALSVLALAPFFAWPVLFVTLPVLVWLLDCGRVAAVRQRVWRAALLGWWFGFGYFALGLFWIGEAFLVEADVFAWLLPVAVTAMPAGLALFWAAATAVSSRYWPAGPQRLVSLALTLSAAEWLRGHVLTGFPWNVLGYALTAPLPLMQASAWIGIYGLTLLVVLVGTLPAIVWCDARRGDCARSWRFAGIGASAFVLAAIGALGWQRLANHPTTFTDGVQLRLVQPSVAQRDKWRPEFQERIFLDHLALSTTGPEGTTTGLTGITHIVWPEAAMPFLPLDTPQALAAISNMLGSGPHLITGALRAEPPPPASGRTRRQIFNSIMVFSEGAQLTGLYDKIHLVPFGEYLPLQTLLESIGLEQLSRMRGGFSGGALPRPLLTVAGLPPVSGLVCYEAIFPGAIVQGPVRPAALFNVTNDGWFGNTTGPRQHLHQARVRAVEEGAPLIRAANNGISAVIDPYGRLLAQLPMDVRGALDSRLPLPMAAPPLYARFGDSAFWLMWVGGWLGLLVYRRHSHLKVAI